MVERSLDVEASLDCLRRIGLWMRDAARAADLPYEVAFGLDLAVHEAVENVVRHGGGTPRRVRLAFSSDARRATVVVVDDGPEFDPLSVPMPMQPSRIEDVIPGGQGVHLMRHFAEVRYRREAGKNVLTLERSLPTRHDVA